MNIILAQNFKNLGNIGDVVKVKDGYARNYLLPRQMAMAATDSNVASNCWGNSINPTPTPEPRNK